MKITKDIVALIHFSQQKRRNIMYNYFVHGYKNKIAKHFNTSTHLLTKHCKLLLEEGYAIREGNHLRIYSIQHIIYLLDEDDPKRKLLRILRGVYKIHETKTMKGLSFHEVKLKIIVYLTHNHYKIQEWNIRQTVKPLKRSGHGQLNNIADGTAYSSLRMFSKYFGIPISTLARYYKESDDLGYIDREPKWIEGKIPGMWSVTRKVFNETTRISLCGYYYKVKLY